MAGTGGPKSAVQVAFGARVRARREELGWSQERLAFAAGLHRTYIGTVESGERNPALRTLVRLARALSVDASDLVGGLQDLV